MSEAYQSCLAGRMHSHAPKKKQTKVGTIRNKSAHIPTMIYTPTPCCKYEGPHTGFLARVRKWLEVYSDFGASRQVAAAVIGFRVVVFILWNDFESSEERQKTRSTR